jgi:hypothetical protein
MSCAHQRRAKARLRAIAFPLCCLIPVGARTEEDRDLVIVVGAELNLERFGSCRSAPGRTADSCLNGRDLFFRLGVRHVGMPSHLRPFERSCEH